MNRDKRREALFNAVHQGGAVNAPNVPNFGNTPVGSVLEPISRGPSKLESVSKALAKPVKEN